MPGSRKCEAGCTCQKHVRRLDLTDAERADRHRQQSRDSMRRYYKSSVCPDCGQQKTPASALCQSCRRNAPSDEELEARRQRRLERNREYMRSLRANDPDGAWVEKERARNRLHGRRYFLKHRYGISPEQWQEMHDTQGGACYLCGDPFGESRVDIDHDHSCCPAARSCGKCIRGLACQGCNQGIGQFGDDPDRMERVAGNLRAAHARLITESR